MQLQKVARKTTRESVFQSMSGDHCFKPITNTEQLAHFRFLWVGIEHPDTEESEIIDYSL